MAKINFTKLEFINEIRALIDNDKYKYSGKWTILRHCIVGSPNYHQGKRIMNEGLNITSGNSLYTATPLGRLDYNEVNDIINQNREYLSPNNWSSGVIIAAPVELINSKNEKIYLGEITRKNDSDKYHASSILDIFFKHMRGIDYSFILGYFEKKENGTIDFEFNENFISFLSQEKKDKLFESIKLILQDELILPVLNPNTDVEEINSLKERYENLKMRKSDNYILKTINQLLIDYPFLREKSNSRIKKF